MTSNTTYRDCPTHQWKPTAQRDERCICPPSEFDAEMAKVSLGRMLDRLREEMTLQPITSEWRNRADFDPCGECPKGTCDHCWMCDQMADLH